MSKIPVQFDSGETYDRLMAEVESLESVVNATKDMEPHLKHRLDRAVKNVKKFVLDEKPEPEYHGHVNLDADPTSKDIRYRPQVEAQLGRVFSRVASAVTKINREEEG